MSTRLAWPMDWLQLRNGSFSSTVFSLCVCFFVGIYTVLVVSVPDDVKPVKA